MKRILIFVAAMIAATASLKAANLAEKISRDHNVISQDEWYGGHRIKFDFEGLTAWIVEPVCEVAQGTPWTWTMQWADAFVPRTSVPELLAKGWHHVTLDAFEGKASDEFLPTFARFQDFLVKTLGFSPKACLIGMSWGGFFSTRYAASYPENVGAIYLDAPFLNFEGSNADLGPWEKPLQGCWTDDPRMPVNMAQTIAEAGIPILLLYGERDTVVNPELNCKLFASRFIQAGGDIKIIARGMWDHHPHGLDPGDTGEIQNLFER